MRMFDTRGYFASACMAIIIMLSVTYVVYVCVNIYNNILTVDFLPEGNLLAAPPVRVEAGGCVFVCVGMSSQLINCIYILNQ